MPDEGLGRMTVEGCKMEEGADSSRAAATAGFYDRAVTELL